MKKYKVRITRENFKNFADYYNTDKKRVEELFEQLSKEFYRYQHPAAESASRMFERHFMGHENRKNTFSLESTDNQILQYLVNYCDDNDLMWLVEDISEHYLYISFSGNGMFWDKQFCTIVQMPDYDGLSLGEIQTKLGSDIVTDSLPAEVNALSLNSINAEKDKVHTAQEQLKKLEEDIKFARTTELRKMEEEIRKLQDALYKRKQVLLADLNKKMAAMKEQMDILNQQIYMMEAEIYSIRSYNGETIELKKVRSGQKASPETPLVVNQKLIYLDEDLARIVSIYQSEIANHYTYFEDALRECDSVFESFCPQERCVTFFRLSKNATYRYFNSDTLMYKSEELIHGKKIGFILKDGECAYIGWMDETWRKNEEGEPVPVTFSEDLMYKPEKETAYYDADDLSKIKNDSQNTMLSRAFAMFVVQGIIDNEGILQFPEKVSITKPGPYIIYNFATGWLMDDRFGDFASLVNNLNKRTKVNDTILICYNKHFCRGRGEADRTHDCEVPEGINRVNFLESDEYGHCDIYVSAKKRYSSKGATANVKVSKNEYINITYMNSIWLSYYIQTKKLGTYSEDYAKMIKHFKRAIEILKEREGQEIALVKKYYPAADQVHEWEIKLSHWKLNHNIRFINDFQAKRIAKYLQEGIFRENENLFNKETFYGEEATNNKTFSRTNFRYVTEWNKRENATEFGEGSSYYMQTFFIKDLNTRFYLSPKERDENEATIAKELPKLEALVPKRLEMDEKKLQLVNEYVYAFMCKHNVSIKDLTECPFGLSFDNDTLGFIKVASLDQNSRSTFFNLAAKSTYPEYILKSDCWKVAYYDYVHTQYDQLLHDVKLVLHHRFMNNTISVL